MLGPERPPSASLLNSAVPALSTFAQLCPLPAAAGQKPRRNSEKKADAEHVCLGAIALDYFSFARFDSLCSPGHDPFGK